MWNGIQHSSQFLVFPKDSHLKATMHLLKYLHSTVSFGMFYPTQQNMALTGFNGVEWASCLHTRLSLFRFCIILGRSLISWKTKMRPTVSCSSTESGYRSMAATTAELLWLSYILKDLHVNITFPVTLFRDNRSTQLFAANPCFHDKSKHFSVYFHFMRDKVQDGILRIAHISSQSQIADIFTKSFCKPNSIPSFPPNLTFSSLRGL